ncbi:hypothetical protein PVW46_18380 [Mameliella sp. AT18]|uniref:hypothetical protein n=1 Tax=Mameliella sp. AT18 TaxID=3028385 RepID=UPI0008410EA7|nr:hypothetical protein [Mameliella sp. AT18]MDD9731877.1 hypothetical protein [Mameliella sp. AT18]ODM46528.1 hypothetical protein A9320_26250 [Ruegeria sp. PBVC088]
MYEPYQVRQSGYGWAVFNRRTREKVSNQVSSRSVAEDRCDELNREARRRRRPCICCGVSFISEGPHNRMCNGCRHGADPFDRRQGLSA